MCTPTDLISNMCMYLGEHRRMAEEAGVVVLAGVEQLRGILEGGERRRRGRTAAGVAHVADDDSRLDEKAPACWCSVRACVPLSADLPLLKEILAAGLLSAADWWPAQATSTFDSFAAHKAFYSLFLFLPLLLCLDWCWCVWPFGLPERGEAIRGRGVGEIGRAHV